MAKADATKPAPKPQQQGGGKAAQAKGQPRREKTPETQPAIAKGRPKGTGQLPARPRVRDFKGVPPKGFDGRGNYALGLREQLIFPEIVYDKIDKVRGMDVIFVTTARTDEDARALLAQLGMPFRES